MLLWLEEYTHYVSFSTNLDIKHNLWYDLYKP